MKGVNPAHQFDESRLEAYLQGTIVGFRGPMRVRQFEGGLSNPTYFVETEAQKYVLRRKPPGLLLKSAHAVDREFRVMSALKNAGFPVPEPLVLCEDESIIGSIFYVMHYVKGRIFMDVSMPDLEKKERSALYDSANRTLASLHKFKINQLGLEDFGRPGNFFGRQIARWIKQYEASKTENIPVMERLMTWLPTAIPADEEATLVHGDFSFHNLIVATDEPKVIGVLDWELSTTGHPVADLMYHAMEWYRPSGIDPRGSLRNLDLPALGIPTLDEYVALYCERMERAPIENLAFHKAYNLFRVAAIWQGVVARSRAGTATSSDSASFAARIPPLAEAAWEFAREAGAS